MNLQVWAMKMARSPGIHYHGPHCLKCFNHFHCIENIQDKQQYTEWEHIMSHYSLRNAKG